MQHRAQLTPPGRQKAATESLPERLHHRKAGEDRGQVVAVRHAGGGLGVVLHEPDLAGEEAVESGRWRRVREPWVGECETFLFGFESQLEAEVGVLEDRLLERGQRAMHALSRGNRLLVAAARHQLGPDGDAQRPLAEHQAALALPFGERLGARGHQVLVVEQRMVGRDRVRHACTGSRDGVFLT